MKFMGLFALFGSSFVLQLKQVKFIVKHRDRTGNSFFLLSILEEIC